MRAGILRTGQRRLDAGHIRIDGRPVGCVVLAVALQVLRGREQRLIQR